LKKLEKEVGMRCTPTSFLISSAILSGYAVHTHVFRLPAPAKLTVR
jgi:hypothetical protein